MELTVITCAPRFPIVNPKNPETIAPNKGKNIIVIIIVFCGLKTRL